MDTEKAGRGTLGENRNENVTMDLGLTLKDRKRNDDIRRILGVAYITDKVREARLRWYGHVQRRAEDDCVKRILEANVGGQQSTGRQRKRWIDVVKYKWRTCSSTWRMQSIELNGEEEPVWLTPYLRDPQPEGERERECLDTVGWVFWPVKPSPV